MVLLSYCTRKFKKKIDFICFSFSKVGSILLDYCVQILDLLPDFESFIDVVLFQGCTPRSSSVNWINGLSLKGNVFRIWLKHLRIFLGKTEIVGNVRKWAETLSGNNRITIFGRLRKVVENFRKIVWNFRPINIVSKFCNGLSWIT